MTKKIFLFFTILNLFISNVLGWEKVPVPDYVNKKTKSPWNFYDDFEDQEVGRAKLRKKYNINDKGTGSKPFKIKQDLDGNKFLEVTVKHGWNKCCGSWVNTERAEFEAKKKRSLNREIWYGFRMRLPEDFIHINDRVLISQFKNQFNPMKKSPLVGIQFYDNGDTLRLRGDTGGVASTKWNDKESKIHKVGVKYFKNNDKWNLIESKIRGEDKIKLSNCNFSKSNKNQNLNNNNCFGCYDYFTRKVCCYDVKGNPIWKDPLYVNTKSEFKKCKKFNNFKKTFKATKLGNWTTYKIGIKNSKKKDGFVKIYKDDQLMWDYSGVTFDWKGQYIGSIVRIGIYRDSDPSGKGYPVQSIHYDDFTVVSDKKTLDKYLGN